MQNPKIKTLYGLVKVKYMMTDAFWRIRKKIQGILAFNVQRREIQEICVKMILPRLFSRTFYNWPSIKFLILACELRLGTDQLQPPQLPNGSRTERKVLFRGRRKESGNVIFWFDCSSEGNSKA